MGCFDSSSHTSSSLPDWLKSPNKSVSTAAGALLAQPYTPYKGELVAPMTGSQNYAMSYIRNLLGDPNGFQTPRLIDNIPGMGKAGGSLQDYMDPYVGEALAPTLREIRQNTDQAMQGVDARSQFTGGFRDTGSALQRTETERLGTQAVGDATSKAYEQAFQNAMQERNMDINRLMENRAAGLQAAGGYFDMGSKEQATNQALDAAKFSEFMRKTGYDMNKVHQIAEILGILNGAPVNTQTSPSTASQITGGLGALGGLIAIPGLGKGVGDFLGGLF